MILKIVIDEVISPKELKNIKPPKLPGDRGVIISGRAPVWLYGFLVHYYHPTRWVGIYDPRLGGAVVVQSHYPGIREGDIIKIRGEENV